MLLLQIFFLWIMSMSSLAASAKTSLYVNAKIFSGTEILPDSDAFLIKDGRFMRIGRGDDLKNLAEHVAIIDLKGALVLPGFIESHGHLLGLGQSKLMLDLRNLAPSQIAALVEQQSKKQARHTWIKGRGWDQNLWPNKIYPDKILLKNVDHPVYLRRVDGHAVLVNDIALKIAKIDKSTKDVPGGQILRDINGHPTGVFIDNATSLFDEWIYKHSAEDLRTHLNLASDQLLSLGITSFHDAGIDKQTAEFFEQAAQKNELRLRIYAMLDGNNPELIDNFFKRGPVKVGDFLSIRAIKHFADGALGSRGAYLLEDYADQRGHRGLLLMQKNDLIEKTKKALAHGFQIATHAIGDGANRMVLDAYEEALQNNNEKDHRLSIEHAQLVDPSDHHRFKKLSVIASMQPIHCTSDMAWVKDRISQDRIKERAYPWRSLLNHKAILAFGSDVPVEDPNPILGIYAAVTRADLSSKPLNGFMPEQKLTLKEALHGYFFGGAYAEFNEHQKGKIAPGYLADFVVFDVDILEPTKTSFISAKPLMTVVDGQVVYRRH